MKWATFPRSTPLNISLGAAIKKNGFAMHVFGVETEPAVLALIKCFEYPRPMTVFALIVWKS
jgi:hypothetical protein